MEKPIVAISIFDIPEILNRCGWIVEPENPKPFAEAIQYVFNHPTEATEMGLKAREKLEREYSWDIMEESLMGIFERY